MNIFRILGDMSHLASKFILIHRIFQMRSCRGLSLKTQVVYLIVFVTRYLDLFTSWISMYNTLMKIFYILSSTYILYIIVEKFRPMDDEESTDTFPVQYIFTPCIILSLLFNYRFAVFEVLWSFSIFLEALAILPQLHMLRITGQAEALTRYYIITLGLYRALYIPNWIWRYTVEGMLDPIAIVGGIFQTCLNFYFIYVYWRKYPRESDIEYAPETLPPPVVAGGLPLEARETPADTNTPEAPNIPEVANAPEGLAASEAQTPPGTSREPEPQKTDLSSNETPVGVKIADNPNI